MHWLRAVRPEVSIPARVAHLDLAVLYPHRESRGRLVRGCAECFTGAYAEARAVARADDHVAFEVPAGQLTAVVRADVFDRVVLIFDVEDHDVGAVDVGDMKRSGW